MKQLDVWQSVPRYPSWQQWLDLINSVMKQKITSIICMVYAPLHNPDHNNT